MENQNTTTIICPSCAFQVPETAYYCPNCGRKLREKPVSLSVWSLTGLFLMSIFLPPFGLGMTFRYLKATNETAKVIGIISLALTVIVLVVAVRSMVEISKNINQMVNQQLNFPGGF